jgi:putative PIN family toxin of toxin-antitoxin system
MTARRAVIDTNVLISAALSPGGTAAAVTRWFIRHGRLIFSSETFAELESRLMRSKFDRYVTRAIRLDVLRDLGAVAEWVEVRNRGSYSRDSDDDKFIDTARAGGAQILVSGDADLTDLKSVAGLPILTPRQCLDWLESLGR